MKFELYVYGNHVATCNHWTDVYDVIMEKVYSNFQPSQVSDYEHMNCANAESWAELIACNDGDEYEVDDFRLVAVER